MASITLKNIDKYFGKERVIDQLNLTIEKGLFTVLVGPSGCGKTTTLRMIAGLEQQSSGEIWIGDRCVNKVQPGKRDVAMVFQNYALYPTMSVKGNIEFGLKNRKVPREERERLIKEISEIVGLSEYINKKPENLSGGQRQRVALARAMVKKPAVFLMDEPLSNLDALLRNQMRTELIQLHKRLGTTIVYVTHDQVEAMSMGDRIVVMNKGYIQQIASPLETYYDPANLFTAQFIGVPSMNILTRENLSQQHLKIPQDVTYIGFRPEKVNFMPQKHEVDSIQFIGDIATKETLGAENLYQMKMGEFSIRIKNFGVPIDQVEAVQTQVLHKDLYYFNKDGERLRQFEQRQSAREANQMRDRMVIEI